MLTKKHLYFSFTLKATTTALDTPVQETPARKIIRNGQLLILRNGKAYTLSGAEIP